MALVGAATIAVLASTASVATALPPEPPLATSDNVEILDHIPGTAAGMNFKDHYAFVTGWDGLQVLDIATPESPQLVGGLPIAHFENEDVDLCGDTLLIVNDREYRDMGSIMYVVDISDPAAPSLAAMMSLGNANTPGRGPGHIANFVTADCSQAWVDGGDHVGVVDLSDPSAPVLVGKFESPAATGPKDANGKPTSAFVASHDTELDSTGTIWNVGGGGAAGYRLTDDPLAPELLATTGAAGNNNDFVGANSPYNDFILHNSQRRGKTLLITEEDYVDSNGDDEVPGGCRGQGKFETWSLKGLKKGQITPQDTWKTELNGMLTGGAEDSKAPVTANCSSHWFDAQDGVAAVGWYEQGVRFLSYESPTDIKQVGYYIPANGATWAAYWSPTDPNGEIVYTADATRGVDVLRIENGGHDSDKVRAPIAKSWFGSPTSTSTAFDAHPTFGYVCPVLKSGIALP